MSWMYRWGGMDRKRNPGMRMLRLYVGVTCLSVSGCAGIAANDQRLLSKPNMLYSDSLVFNYGNPLQSQVEPGSVSAGGAKSSGCTSCK